MRRIYILLLLILACCSMMLHAENETSYLPLIGTRQGGVVEQSHTVELTMSVDLSKAKIRTQHTIILTPVLMSADSSREVTFPPIVIDSKTHHEVHLRVQRPESVELPPLRNDSAQVIMRHSSKGQYYDYAAAVPYERWTLDGRIKTCEEVHGCVNRDKGKAEQSLQAGILPAHVPDYKLNSIALEPEPVKVCAETRTARLRFRQDSYNILPGFKSNRAELDTVSNSIELVKKNTDIKVIGIHIIGYAPPEGSMAHNMALSKNRAKTLADYIRHYDATAPEMFHVDWKGEDWESFARMLGDFPGLLKRGEVYEIVERYPDEWDFRELQLQKLVPPTIYHRLFTEIYPASRRNEYRTEYNVRNFNLEETRRTVDEHLDLLSLSEMYKMADPYGKDTPRYDKAITTALHYLLVSPPVFNKNAVNAISCEEHAKVVELFEKLETTARSAELLSTFSVAHAGAGQYDKAEDVFRRVSEAGSATAWHNLGEVRQATDQLQTKSISEKL